jgi:hypothetical protein
MPVTEAEWLAATDPGPMLAFVRDRLSDRKLRLFACACCRAIWDHLFEDSRPVVEVAERFADGEVDRSALAQCRDEAFDLMCEAVCSSGSAPWLVTVDPPMPENPPGFRPPATVFDAAAATADATSAAVREDYFVTHPVPTGPFSGSPEEAAMYAEAERQNAHQARLLRCIVGPIARLPVATGPRPAWKGAIEQRLAWGVYGNRRMPEGTFDLARLVELADALERAGCGDGELLGHLRLAGVHVRPVATTPNSSATCAGQGHTCGGVGRWIWCWERVEGMAVRRRTLLVALAGLAVVVAAGVAVLWPRPPSRITRENFDRIKEGMSRTEVEGILGPAGDYSTGPTQRFMSVEDIIAQARLDTFSLHSGELTWSSDMVMVRVEFDSRGVATAKYFTALVKLKQTFVDSLIWRAERQWRHWFRE